MDQLFGSVSAFLSNDMFWSNQTGQLKMDIFESYQLPFD